MGRDRRKAGVPASLRCILEGKRRRLWCHLKSCTQLAHGDLVASESDAAPKNRGLIGRKPPPESSLDLRQGNLIDLSERTRESSFGNQFEFLFGNPAENSAMQAPSTISTPSM